MISAGVPVFSIDSRSIFIKNNNKENFVNELKIILVGYFQDDVILYKKAIDVGNKERVVTVSADEKKLVIDAINGIQNEFGFENLFRENQYVKNPFLASYFKSIFPQQPVFAPMGIASATTTTVGPVLNALVEHVSAQFYEELRNSLFKLLSKYLDEHKYIAGLFSRTSKVISENQSYNYKNIFLNLKTSFQNDLQNIQENVLNVILDNRAILIDFLKNHVCSEEVANQSYDFLISVIGIYKTIRSSKYDERVFEDLINASIADNNDNKTFSKTMAAVFMISKCLAEEKPDIQMLGAIMPSFKDTQNFLLFFGLIYAQSKYFFDSITINNVSFVDHFFDEAHSKKIELVLKSMPSLLNSVSEIEKSLNIIKNARKLDADGEYNLLTALINLYDIGYSWGVVFSGGSIIGDAIETSRISDFGKIIVNIFSAIQKKEYVESISELLTLLNIVIPKYEIQIPERIDGYKNIKKAFLDSSEAQVYLNERGDLKRALKPANSENREGKTNKVVVKLKENNFREKLNYYANIIINALNANSEEECEKVLNLILLPTGSYQTKQASGFSIAVNSYAGLFGGATKFNQNNKLNGAFTVSAPIGICLSTNRILPGSLCLFGSIIDIGAAVDLRLSGYTGDLPVISWKDIIAPGIFILWGVKNTPLSVGPGIQWGPHIIKSDNNITTIQGGYFRVGIMAFIDMPFFFIKNWK